MSDDLVKRIKDRGDWLVDAVATATQNRQFLRGEPECDDVACEAIRLNGEKAMEVIAKPLADRIEELERELHLMKTAGIVEVSVKNPSVMEYMKHWEGRAEAAEAKLAKAVRLMDLSVELARWELNPKLQHDVIVFCNNLKGHNDEPNE